MLAENGRRLAIQCTNDSEGCLLLGQDRVVTRYAVMMPKNKNIEKELRQMQNCVYKLRTQKSILESFYFSLRSLAVGVERIEEIQSSSIVKGNNRTKESIVFTRNPSFRLLINWFLIQKRYVAGEELSGTTIVQQL